MSNEVAEVSPIPPTLMPYLLSPSEFQIEGRSSLPAPVVDMDAYRKLRPVRRVLMPWGPVSLVGTLGSSGLTAMSAISLATTGSIGAIVMLACTSLATVATGSVVAISLREDFVGTAEYNWLVDESEKRLRDWIKSQLGVDAAYIEVKTGELIEFVNEQAAGEIEFGVADRGRWKIWRDELSGPLATDYEPQVTRKISTWGTTKKTALDDLFGRRGRDGLREAMTLLNQLATSKDVETKHRVERARQMLTEVEALANRTTTMSPKGRAATITELTQTVAAVVADLTAAKHLHEQQVEHEAKVLSRYANKVANLDQNSQLQLPG